CPSRRSPRRPARGPSLPSAARRRCAARRTSRARRRRSVRPCRPSTRALHETAGGGRALLAQLGLAQLHAPHFAAARLRQLAHELDLTRILVGRGDALAVLLDLTDEPFAR